MEKHKAEKQRTANSTYPRVTVQWLKQALYFFQNTCLVDSFVLRNSLLLLFLTVASNIEMTETIEILSPDNNQKKDFYQYELGKDT